MIACKLSEVRRQSDKSSWKMESLAGRMEESARKIGRGQPPLERDKTPAPWGLAEEQILGYSQNTELTLFLPADPLCTVEGRISLLHTVF